MSDRSNAKRACFGLILLVLAGAALWMWWPSGTGGFTAEDESTQRALERASGGAPGDQALSDWLEQHGADELSEQEVAALVLEFERQRAAERPDAEFTDPRVLIDD